MPQWYKLKKTLVAGTSYRAESDKFYVIKRVGTNSATALGTLTVAGAKCLEMLNTLAPLNMTTTNWIDLYELGDYQVVVPPNKAFVFTGDASSKMLIEGMIGEMMTPADFPADLAARLSEQAKRFVTVKQAKYEFATNASWAADAEVEVLTITATAGERHIIDDRLYIDVANLSALPAAGEIALRFYYQDKPLDILDATMGKFGLDMWNGHWNDGTNRYWYPIDLSDMPFQLEPGRTLKIKARNVKGVDLSAASNTKITVTVGVIDKYTMLP